MGYKKGLFKGAFILKNYRARERERWKIEEQVCSRIDEKENDQLNPSIQNGYRKKWNMKR